MIKLNIAPEILKRNNTIFLCVGVICILAVLHKMF